MFPWERGDIWVGKIVWKLVKHVKCLRISQSLFLDSNHWAYKRPWSGLSLYMIYCNQWWKIHLNKSVKLITFWNNLVKESASLFWFCVIYTRFCTSSDQNNQIHNCVSFNEHMPHFLWLYWHLFLSSIPTFWSVYQTVDQVGTFIQFPCSFQFSNCSANLTISNSIRKSNCKFEQYYETFLLCSDNNVCSIPSNTLLYRSDSANFRQSGCSLV